MRSLIWFRNDLRITDNTALYHACARSDQGVIAVFHVSPKQWQSHDWGPNKVDFVLRCLAVLKESLEVRGIPLKIIQGDRFSDVPAALLKLAKAVQCGALFFNREYEVNEAKRDADVTDAFENAGLAVHAYHDQTVIPPADIHTANGDIYTVFSPFKRKWIDTLKQRQPLELRPTPKKQAPAKVKSDDVPTDVKHYRSFSDAVRDHWPAGETEAKRRLTRFINAGLDNYKKQRDLPALHGTSSLSPYLACGAISARQCLLAAMEANNGRLDSGKQGPLTWISELIWREFYRHVMVGFPRVCRYQPFKENTTALKWNDDDALFERWCEGKTGVPIVDAAQRQLVQTGWMHNRLRMISAMYLTKDLFIDWRRGESFFMQHLVDGDLASNNGGWQWSASTGTDAAPYFRIFNPYTQSERFDPDGAFIRQFCPELKDVDDGDIHDPTTWPPLMQQALDYPEPVVNHKQARLRAIAAFKALG